MRLTVLAAVTALAVVLHSNVAVAYEPLDDPNLLGWWAFDETSGKTAEDTSVHGRDGQVSGVALWPQGVYGNALKLRDPAYLEIPSVDSTLSEATMAAWIKPNGDQPDYATILAEGSASFNLMSDFQIGYHWNGTSSSYAYQTGLYVVPDQWNFITVAVAPDAASFYLNGEFVSANVAPHGPLNWNKAVYLGGTGADSDIPRLTDATLDDVSLFGRALKPRQVVRIMQGLDRPEIARAPVPDDDATDVCRDTILTWQAGASASSHNVYLGTVLDDVAQATPDDPRGVLVAENQQDAAYVPPMLLAFGQTYYWRIDEVASSSGNSVVTGDVWGFTVEPEFYVIENVSVVASFPCDANRGPENTINGFGLDAAEQHGTAAEAMCLGDAIIGEPLVLQYNFDSIYSVEQIRVWNFNHISEPDLNFSLKDMTIEYQDGTGQWLPLGGDFQLEQGPGTPDYTGQALNPPAAVAKAIRLIATSNYGGMKYGLSEVRFYMKPVQARKPLPASGTLNVPLNPVLSWRSGREAAAHKIHFSVDPDAVEAGRAFVDATEIPVYEFAGLDLGTTYFWRIDEVNEAKPIPVWPGKLWSFTTERYAILDDFESYTDQANQRVFDTWIDGLGIGGNGSQVGYDQAPYGEAEIVHGGAWSMPFIYENRQGVILAETERTFAPSQNWTQGGIKAVALHFYGKPGNTGDLYLEINGEVIPYVGSQADLAKAQWQTWLVDLSTVQADVTAVTTLTIGVEGEGAAGKLYFDDIWLVGGDVSATLPMPPDTNGLILRYALDEGVGPDVRDTSGNGHNGTLGGQPEWTTGVYGRAMSFDGLLDHIDTEVALLNDVAEFSIACWVKANFASQTPRSFVGQYECIEFGLVESYVVQLATADGGILEFDWPYRDTTASWHHLVATGDGVSLKLYLDGLLVAAGGEPLDSAGYGTSESTTKIGGGVLIPEGSWFIGELDEIHIFQRAITAAEAAALAGRTAPFFEPLDP